MVRSIASIARQAGVSRQAASKFLRSRGVSLEIGVDGRPGVEDTTSAVRDFLAGRSCSHNPNRLYDRMKTERKPKALMAYRLPIQRPSFATASFIQKVITEFEAIAKMENANFSKSAIAAEEQATMAELKAILTKAIIKSLESIA